MTARIRVGAVLLLASALCSVGQAYAQDVKYDYDRTANFTSVKTYKWVRIEGATYPNQLEDKNLRATIDAELAKKGMVAKADTADVLLAYQLLVTEDKQIDTYGGGAGWRRGIGTATIQNVDVGTLVVDFYDPVTKTLIWQGSGTKAMDNDPNPDKRQEKLAKSVAKLMKYYPPPKK